MRDHEKSLLAHIFVECYYRNDLGLIAESYILNENKTELFEEYGVFYGCEDIAEEILKEVRNLSLEPINPHEERCAEIKVNSDFIKSIYLIVFNEKAKRRASFYPSESKIVKFKDGTRKYNPLAIGVNTAKAIDLGVIMHELTHAYDDYNRTLNRAKTLTDKSNEIGYGKMLASNNDLTLVLYYLSSFEKNAFVAQISGEMQEIGKRFRTAKEAFDALRKTKTYSEYNALLSILNQICDSNSEPFLDYILRIFNNSSNHNFKTISELKHFCKVHRRKLERKFNSVIPKLVYKHLMQKEVIPPSLDHDYKMEKLKRAKKKLDELEKNS